MGSSCRDTPERRKGERALGTRLHASGTCRTEKSNVECCFGSEHYRYS